VAVAAGGGLVDFVVVVAVLVLVLVVVVVGVGGGGGGGLSMRGSHAEMAARESATVLRIDSAMPTCSSAARQMPHRRSSAVGAARVSGAT
jgi:hypothetical protein